MMAEKKPPAKSKSADEEKPEPKTPHEDPLPLMSDEEAAEVARQLEKQHEFAAKAKAVLEASVRAKKQLAAKQEELDSATKLSDEAKRVQEGEIEQAKAEAARVKSHLEQEYKRAETGYQKSIDVLKKQEEDLRAKATGLEKDIRDLDRKKVEARNSLNEFEAQVKTRQETVEKEAAQQKAKLQREIEDLQAALRTLRGTVNKLTSSV